MRLVSALVVIIVLSSSILWKQMQRSAAKHWAEFQKLHWRDYRGIVWARWGIQVHNGEIHRDNWPEFSEHIGSQQTAQNPAWDWPRPSLSGWQPCTFVFCGSFSGRTRPALGCMTWLFWNHSQCRMPCSTFMQSKGAWSCFSCMCHALLIPMGSLTPSKGKLRRRRCG